MFFTDTVTSYSVLPPTLDRTHWIGPSGEAEASIDTSTNGSLKSGPPTTDPRGCPMRSIGTIATSLLLGLETRMTHGQSDGGSAMPNFAYVGWSEGSLRTPLLSIMLQSDDPRVARLPHTDSVTEISVKPSKLTITISPGLTAA